MATKKRMHNSKNVEANFASWKLLDHTRFVIGRLREMELAECGLTPEQSHVLEILVQSGGSTTINDIVDITMRQHHSISTLINRMSKRGLVTKRKNPGDKRRFDVMITPKGQTLWEKTPRQCILEIFTELSAEERADLDKKLKLLLDKAYELHRKGCNLGVGRANLKQVLNFTTR